LKGDFVNVLQNIGQPGYTFTAAGTGEVGSTKAALVDVNAAGTVIRFWIDPATGRLLRTATETRAMGQAQTKVTDYLEWKTFDGIRTAVHATTSVNGQLAATTTVTNLELNPVVDPSFFAKP
jgi:hypothetical protein